MPKIRQLGTVALCSIALLSMTACESGDDRAAPYKRTEMKDLMGYLDDQAYVIWGNSGSEWDQDGERELFPTTDEGWNALAAAGHELIKIGQDLPGMIDEDDPRSEAWSAYAAGMVEVSQKLVTAAEQHDKQATFDDGGVLYQVCKACHGTFPAPEEVE